MDPERHQMPREDAAGAFFTWRSLLLGALMCALTGIVGPHWTIYLCSNPLFHDYAVPGAVFFTFFLVLFFNVLLRLVSRRLALRTGELLVVAAMMLVGGAVATMGVGHVIQHMAGPYHFANRLNQWRTRLWPYLPDWLSPLDEGGGISAIDRFYVGLKAGERIPWGPWIRPLLLWAVFLVPLYLCMMAMMTIMRKQWVDYERLSFPTVQLVKELCSSAAEPWGRLSLLRSFLFWAGFAIPFFVGSLTALHGYFPAVPAIPIVHTFKGVMNFQIYFSFAMLGFIFLIPNRIAFSLWSLNLVSFLVRWHVRKYGLEMREHLSGYGASNYPIMAHVGMGAMLVFVAAGLWLARRHLARVFRCALGVGNRGYDDGEPCSYRAALIVLALSTVVMLAWLRRTGLSLTYSALLLAAAMIIFFGMTRVVAQCGVAVAMPPMIAPSFVTSAVGAGNLTGKAIGSLSTNFAWCGYIRVTTMNSAAHAMYLARRRPRGLLWAMMLAIAITAVVATVYTIHLGYTHGALNLRASFVRSATVKASTWGVRQIEFGGQANVQGLFWTAVGVATMIALVLAQRTLFWWPIHPVGFLLCSVMDALWFSIFLAWLIKFLVLTFGGTKAFRQAGRFFLGMIMGQFAVAGVWDIINTVTGETWNVIFRI